MAYERLFVAGIGGGNAKFAWAENVWTGAPHWLENNNGLPAAASVGPLKMLPDSGIGFLLIDGVLWRNTALRTGGVWTQVLNAAIIQPLTGHPGQTVAAFDITETQAGRVYALLNNFGSTYILISNNNGDSWVLGYSNADFVDAQKDIVAGQHVAGRVYMIFQFDLAQDHYALVSSDGALTFAAVNIHQLSGNNRLRLPYDNAADSEAFAYGGTFGGVFRTTNTGVTWPGWTAWSDGNIIAEFARDNSNLAFYAYRAGAPVHLHLPTSADRSATWTDHDYGSDAAIVAIAFPRTGFYYFVGNGGLVFTSADAITWTNRQGDLPAYNLSAVVPDQSSDVFVEPPFVDYPQWSPPEMPEEPGGAHTYASYFGPHSHSIVLGERGTRIRVLRR